MVPTLILAAATLFTMAVPRADAEEKALLFLGDSLTAGFGLTPEQAFPALIQSRIDSTDLSGLRVRVINGGQSGEASAGGVRRIHWLLRRQIDILVLALGANDGLRGLPLDDVQRNLQGIVDGVKARYSACRVVIAGMEAPPNMGSAYTAGFRNVFRDLAEDNDTVLIPFLLEGVGGIPELNLADRKHPNPKGHRVIADTVWEALEPILIGLAGPAGDATGADSSGASTRSNPPDSAGSR